MASLLAVPKRILLGRARPSSSADDTLLPKRLALPVFAADPVSSVAWATQEILVILALGGTALLVLAPEVALAVCVVIAIVVVSYGPLVRAYPGGGGSFAVASRNLGPRAGLVAAASLLVDYTLTVAVAVAAAVDNLVSALPVLDDGRIPLAVASVLVVAAVNLRGRREAGWSAMVPVYGFVLAVAVLVTVGLVRWAGGEGPVAVSADFDVDRGTDLTAVALALVVLRAFASGGAALAGVDATANGVPAFRAPKGRNAAVTLLAVGGLSIALIAGVVTLAVVSGVTVTRDPCDLQGLPVPCEEYTQQSVLTQLSQAVFGAGSVGAVLVTVATVLALLTAANSAFNGFPLLAATLAEAGYLPRQLARRGDRLAYSNGILALSLGAVTMLLVLEARVGPLLDLYLIGLFTSFTLAQLGMVRHWRLRQGRSRRTRRWVPRLGTAVAAVAATCTGLTLLVLVVAKVPNGAWATLLVVAALGVGMHRVRGHYDLVSRETAIPADEAPETMPARVHAVVLVSRLHRPTTRALAYARATRPSTLEAVTVAVDQEAARELSEEWARRKVPVPLRVLDSPYREVAKPLVEHVKAVRAKGPRDAVTVFLPEYVVAHWWEAVLHNRSNLWLRARLAATPGVMVVSVPYQLRSSIEEGDLAARAAADRSLVQEASRAGAADRDIERHP
ncbi:APC family permease [Aquipuribacter nitratireducens]|uniref:APC family permease n=1 Tax=Aquipuribacter nitratireducens TaxID=650104 RepID=A0ABW0GIN6_9MICO